MKIFKVDYRDPGFTSEGYGYFTNKLDAEKALRDHNKKWEGGTDSEIAVRDVAIGKVEFLKLLNEWASHPNNG